VRPDTFFLINQNRRRFFLVAGVFWRLRCREVHIAGRDFHYKEEEHRGYESPIVESFIALEQLLDLNNKAPIDVS
jgi:hypothetical protein